MGTIAIAGDAFRDCAGLSEVTLPVTVTVIESGEDDVDIVGTFSGCSSLGEITLPPNLTEIGDLAFDGCTSLSEIALPPGPVDIGSAAFARCPGTPRRA